MQDFSHQQYDPTKIGTRFRKLVPQVFVSQLPMFLRVFVIKLIKFCWNLSDFRKYPSEVGANASGRHSGPVAGPHNLYVVGKVHGVHFRTATRIWDVRKFGMCVGFLQETKWSSCFFLVGEDELTVDEFGIDFLSSCQLWELSEFDYWWPNFTHIICIYIYIF